MALMTVDKESNGDFRSKDRWSANKKLDVVLRLLRGEKLEEVSREVGVEAHRLAAWRDEFLDAGKEGLRGWAESVVAFHRREPRWTGCPLGTLSSELMSAAEIGRLEVQEAFGSWQLLLTRTLLWLQDSGNCGPMPIQSAWPQRHWPPWRAVCSCRERSKTKPAYIALDAAQAHLGTFAST